MFDFHILHRIRSCLVKNKWSLHHSKGSLFLSLFLYAIYALPIVGQNGEELLSKAIYEDEVNGDLEKAMELYSLIIENPEPNRKIQAEAHYRLGLGYEKLGETSAIRHYSIVVSQYNDLSSISRKAGIRLDKLKSRFYERTNSSKNTKRSHSDNTLRIIKVDRPPFAIKAISPDGKFFTYSAPNGNLAIYNRQTKEQSLLTPDPPTRDKGRSLGARSISTKTVWSPDSKKIAYFWIKEDYGNDLRIFDLEANTYKILYPHDDEGVPMPFEWTRDGKQLIGQIWNKKTNRFTFVLIDVNTGIIDLKLELPENEVRTRLGNSFFTISTTVSLSPDKRFLLYDDVGEERTLDIYIADLENKISRKIIAFSNSDERSPLWLPDASGFLFFSDRSNSNALWKAAVNSELELESAEQVVGGLGFIHNHIGLTEDRKYFYWSHIRIMDLYFGALTQNNETIEQNTIIPDPDLRQRLNPVWSPDGQHIAYLKLRKSRSSQENIEIRNIESDHVRVLSLPKRSGLGITYQPVCWSDDMRQILVTVVNSEKKTGVSFFSGSVFEAGIIDIESGKFRTVATDASNAKFGKEGSIFFIRDRAIMKKFLISGIEEVVYANEAKSFHAINLSPSGDLLAFLSGNLNTYAPVDISIINLAERSISSVWSLNDGEYFNWNVAWFPDNQNLLLVTNNTDQESQQMYKLDIVDKSKVRLGSEILKPELKYMGFDLSPDGKRLAYGRRKNIINLWRIVNY